MGRDMMRLRRGILLNTPHEEQASGAVASFATDIGKLKECVVGIEPVQDLHGYDSPWPPGGGKNLLELYLARTSHNGIDFSLTTDWKIHAQGTNSSGATSYSGGNYSTYDNCPWHFPAGTYTISCTVPRSNTDIGTVSFMLRRQSDNEQQNYNQLKNGSSTFTIDEPFGAWFWFSVLNGKTVDIDVGLQLEKGSTATSWTPYENICPISGWSEANVYDDPKYDRTINWNQLADSEHTSGDHFAETWASTITGNNGTLIISTTRDSRQLGFNFVNKSILIERGHKYFLSTEIKSCSFEVTGVQLALTTNWASLGSITIAYTGEKVYSAIITSSGDGVLGQNQRFVLRANGTSVIGDSVTFSGCVWIDLTAMLGEGNEPSTVAEFKALFPHDYYAYNAGEETLVSAVNGEPYRAVTIDLDGTRYGGMLNVLTGLLRVTMVGINLGSLNYSYDNRPVLVHPRFVGALQYAGKRETYWSKGICSCYPVTVNIGQVSRDNVCGVVDKYVYIVDTDYTDATALHNALTDQYIVYNIASPFTVQLTPAQLRAIKGQNNIFADCGDVAVKYWKH